MSKSTAQIKREVTLYQCCVADMAIDYIYKELSGQQNIDCLLKKFYLATELLDGLKCSQNLLNNDCLTQTEIETMLEQLNDICGCVACESSTDLLDDTLPNGFNLLLQETGFIRY